MRKMIAWDIETGPADEVTVRKYMKPYEPPPHPGEFDPSSVKYGNTVDPAKRQKKLDDAAEKHAALLDKWNHDSASGESIAFAAAMDSAALSPILGRIITIGYYSPDINSGRAGLAAADDLDGERKICSQFWGMYEKSRRESARMVGFNIHGFDLPFIAQRSWILGVPVPVSILLKDWKWLDESTFVDLLRIWKLNQHGFGVSSVVKSDLRNVASVLGCHEKTDGVCGGDFWKLWCGTEGERNLAIQYARDDLIATYQVAERLIA